MAPVLKLHYRCTCTCSRGCSTRPQAIRNGTVLLGIANKCMSIFVFLPLLLIIKVLQILHFALVDKICPHTHISLPCHGSSPTWKQIQRACRPVRRWSVSTHTPTWVFSEESVLWGSWSALFVGSHQTSTTHTNTLSCFSSLLGDSVMD